MQKTQRKPMWQIPLRIWSILRRILYPHPNHRKRNLPHPRRYAPRKNPPSPLRWFYRICPHSQMAKIYRRKRQRPQSRSIRYRRTRPSSSLILEQNGSQCNSLHHQFQKRKRTKRTRSPSIISQHRFKISCFPWGRALIWYDIEHSIYWR